ncbi:MAG: hypothetical protein JOY62_17730 [Acidobacteriaceae bacterium]|nr:hypothetical protein [Acidobacteriaceae bacterium]MBV9781808.1 hypothetical protein [Acidobacteriaceae bacterium]
MRRISRFVSLILASILVIGPLSAQTPVTGATPSSNGAPPEDLQLRLIESDGAEIPVNSHSAKGFLIEVTDSRGTPVPDAVVTLRLPDAAPNGKFADGTHSAVAYTDQTGRAKIGGILCASTPGPVAIRATATKGTAHSGVLIQLTLTSTQIAAVPPPPPQVAPEAPPPVELHAEAPPVVPASPPVEPKVEVTSLGQPAKAPDLRSTPISPKPAAPLTSAGNDQPAVSVVNAPGAEKVHSSKTKWIILAAVAAAAGGAGVAMMGKKSSSGASNSGPGISIGSPGISVGGPH